MKYPVFITFTETLTCFATFPDHPGILVEGPDPSTTLENAAQLLTKTISARLNSKDPVSMPSPCKLGHQLISVPETLAREIAASNNVDFDEKLYYLN
jgi:predicted RNase H-like HicB family nuclease